MSTFTPPTTPAGWYTDPSDARTVRWWDGFAWTHHVAPKPAQPLDEWTPVNLVVPQGKTLGVRALVWGIVAIWLDLALLLPSILALVYGITALARAKSLEAQGYPPQPRGLAIAGIVIAGVAALGWISVIVLTATLSRR